MYLVCHAFCDSQVDGEMSMYAFSYENHGNVGFA